MPVRARAVEALTRTLEGGLSFNNLLFRVYLGPVGPERRTITRDEYDGKYDSAYVKMIDSIDWNRVVLEASSRHLALGRNEGHGTTDYSDDLGDEVCPECIREALLAPTWQDWKENPTANRERYP